MLTRDQILQANDLPRERVDVPEWGGVVYVRTMTAQERDDFEQSTLGEDGRPSMGNIRARLAVCTVVDEDGNRLFEDGDAEALGRKSASAVNRIFEVAQRLNRLRADDVDAAVGN